MQKLFDQYDNEKNEVKARFMISPNGVFRLIWDVFIALFIFYVIVTEPMSMGFWRPRILRDSMPLGVVNRVMDVVFIIDLGLNFRTGYFTVDGVLIMSPVKSAVNYALTWFVLDFASSMPPVLELVLAVLSASA